MIKKKSKLINLKKSTQLRIILASESHIYDLAKIHLEALTDGIYAKLGYDFLVNFYKKSMANRNKIFAAFVDNNMVGFLELKQNSNDKFSFNLSVLVKLLKLFSQDPRYIYLIYRRLISSKKEEKNALEISNFSVKEEYRSKGVGRALLERVIGESVNNNLNLFTYTHNKKLARFYEKKYNAKVEAEENLIIYKSYYCKFNLKR